MALDLQTFSFLSRWCQKAERTGLTEHQVPCAQWLQSKVTPAYATYCWDSLSPSLLCSSHLRLQNTHSCYGPPFINKWNWLLDIYSELTVFKTAVESEMGQLLSKCYSHLECCSTRATIRVDYFQVDNSVQKPEMHMGSNSKQMKKLKDPTELVCD